MIIWRGGWIFALFVCLWAAIALYEWVGLSLKTNQKILYLVLGVFYVAVAFWCCYWLRAAFSPEIPLLFICLVWSSDVGAYIAGKTIGGPKMASDISPNKTWAGFIGAFICPALLCLGFFILMRGYSVSMLELAVAVITGVAVGTVGQAGDLVISFLKRKAKVKDSTSLDALRIAGKNAIVQCPHRVKEKELWKLWKKPVEPG